MASNVQMNEQAADEDIPLEDAIKSLTNILQDPMKPDVCTCDLRMAVDRITDHCRDSLSERTGLAKSNPRLLRAIIKFLTMKQSLIQHTAMWKHLTSCQCIYCELRKRSPAEYSRDMPGEIDRWPRLLSNLTNLTSTLVILVLKELSQSKFRSRKPKKERDDQPWPLGPQDLLPFGTDSIAGLSLWAAGSWGFEAIMYQLATGLVMFYPPFGKTLLQVEAAGFTVIVSVRQVEYTLRRFNDRKANSTLSNQDAKDFERQIKTILAFYEVLIDCDRQQVGAFFVGHAWITPVFESLANTLSTLPPLAWNNQKLVVKLILAHTKAKLNPATRVGRVVFDRRELERDIPDCDEVDSAFNTIINTKKGGCCNIGCTAEVEGRTRSCTQCTLVRYCHKGCQREAWRHPQAPHKQLCPKIHNLKQQLGGDTWAYLWHPDYSYENLKGIIDENSVDKKLLEEIGKELGLVRGLKMVYRLEGNASNSRHP